MRMLQPFMCHTDILSWPRSILNLVFLSMVYIFFLLVFMFSERRSVKADTFKKWHYNLLLPLSSQSLLAIANVT